MQTICNSKLLFRRKNRFLYIANQSLTAQIEIICIESQNCVLKPQKYHLSTGSHFLRYILTTTETALRNIHVFS